MGNYAANCNLEDMRDRDGVLRQLSNPLFQLTPCASGVFVSPSGGINARYNKTLLCKHD